MFLSVLPTIMPLHQRRLRDPRSIRRGADEAGTRHHENAILPLVGRTLRNIPMGRSVEKTILHIGMFSLRQNNSMTKCWSSKCHFGNVSLIAISAFFVRKHFQGLSIMSPGVQPRPEAAK